MCIDWFTSDYDAKVENNYTRFWSEKSEGVDASINNSGEIVMVVLCPNISDTKGYFTIYEEMLGLWCNSYVVL